MDWLMMRLEVKKELHSHSCIMRGLQVGSSSAKIRFNTVLFHLTTKQSHGQRVPLKCTVTTSSASFLFT